MSPCNCSAVLDRQCTLTAEVTGRQRLRSATQRKLVIPSYRSNSFGRRRFSVAGPSTWNSLPESLRDPELSLDTFKRQLKTYFCEILMTKCIKRIRDLFMGPSFLEGGPIMYRCCPSVCPSVRPVPPPREKTKRPRKTKLGRKGPWDQLQGQGVRGQGQGG